MSTYNPKTIHFAPLCGWVGLDRIGDGLVTRCFWGGSATISLFNKGEHQARAMSRYVSIEMRQFMKRINEDLVSQHLLDLAC